MPGSREGEGSISNILLGIWNRNINIWPRNFFLLIKELLFINACECVCVPMNVEGKGMCVYAYAQGKQRKLTHILIHSSLPCSFRTGFPTGPQSNHF